MCQLSGIFEGKFVVLFNSMSDLIADAEDIVAALAKSTDPTLQALSVKLQQSVDEMRRAFRRRLKSRARQVGPHGPTLAARSVANAWPAVGITAIAAALLLGY
jgi:ElaB/YqjD/DUF883 family membrane-anchored ribosome-binding protein